MPAPLKSPIIPGSGTADPMIAGSTPILEAKFASVRWSEALIGPIDPAYVPLKLEARSMKSEMLTWPSSFTSPYCQVALEAPKLEARSMKSEIDTTPSRLRSPVRVGRINR